MRIAGPARGRVLEWNARSGVPRAVLGELGFGRRSNKQWIARSAGRQLLRQIGAWIEPERVRHLVECHTGEGSSRHHGVHIGGIESDVADDRQRVAIAQLTDVRESLRAGVTIDRSDRYEQQQVAMCLVESRLSDEALIGGRAEMEIAKVFREGLRPSGDRDSDGTFHRRRSRGGVAYLDLRGRTRWRGDAIGATSPSE